jgi:hypothetical protein
MISYRSNFTSLPSPAPRVPPQEAEEPAASPTLPRAARRRWTDEDVAELRVLLESGWSKVDAAAAINRTPSAVQSVLEKLKRKAARAQA